MDETLLMTPHDDAQGRLMTAACRLHDLSSADLRDAANRAALEVIVAAVVKATRDL